MHVSRRTFDAMVEKAIERLPAPFAAWLEEVPVIVEDQPTKADLQGVEGEEEMPLGLYIGDSLDVGENGSGMPARVMLYRLPLMNACQTQEQLEEEIRKTLLHELGHHAGMDEEDLERHGMGDMEEDENVEWDVE